MLMEFVYALGCGLVVCGLIEFAGWVLGEVLLAPEEE
jgi:hypothetical protein